MLGSRKLLIVLCFVPCILSLVCIGAFAAPAEDVTPSVDLPLDTEVVEDVVKSPSYVSEETFPAQPLLSNSYYRLTIPFNSLPSSTNNAPYCYGFSCFLDGKYVCGGSDGTLHPIYRQNLSEYGIFWNGVQYSTSVAVDGSSSALLSVEIITPYNEYSVGGVTYTGTLVENDLVPDMGGAIFDLGDAFITFVVSSWVVMIPLAAWLVILCIGAIRKLVKGV